MQVIEDECRRKGTDLPKAQMDDNQPIAAQISAMVDDVRQMSEINISPTDFYEAFLARVVACLAAKSGLLWITGQNGRLRAAFQKQFDSLNLFDREQQRVEHLAFVQRVFERGYGGLFQPSTSSDSDMASELKNPTCHLLVFDFVKLDKRNVGLVEVFQRPQTTLNIQRGYLTFLSDMCRLASKYEMRVNQLSMVN
jgi:hypothetical protein